MTRYMIDKLLLEIDRSDESLAAYQADPAAFVAAWEMAARSPVPPYPTGGRLTEEEREAFCPFDAGRLYAMGSHPFLLWHVVRALAGAGDVQETSRRYVAQIEPYGYPDFTT